MPRSFAADGVQVEGLAELQRGLRDLVGKDITRDVLKGANVHYAEFVTAKAQARARGYGGVRSKAASGLSSRGEQRYAVIRMDGTGSPWLLGAEFGSLRYHQFPSWTGNRWTAPPDETPGYFLHPTIRDTAEEGAEFYADELDKALASAFPDGHL
ncbi:MAG TPA: hypothetical protein PKB00_01415 [Microthrixaceae bacterium]|nr:hypothetical protein [Microthrixaceae bacterium]HNH38476.1 hypothetical protein [Microthrixaceae bacterium]HNH94801.1 hypothetical protein [Microthrixaceae bacterium]